MIYKRGLITLICGVLGFLVTKETLGLFLGLLLGFLIEFKVLK